MLENRIKYQNEFVLVEESKSREFMRRIENSQVRLKAIKAINLAYKKMVRVLIQDAIFYDPILRSLSDDMEDQTNFIKHILHLGMPAIVKFKELKYEYFQIEAKFRKSIHEKVSILGSLKVQGRDADGAYKRQMSKKAAEGTNSRLYERETHSMLLLKNVLKVIEGVIRDLKVGTLCSQAKEIYPR